MVADNAGANCIRSEEDIGGILHHQSLHPPWIYSVKLIVTLPRGSCQKNNEAASSGAFHKLSSRAQPWC
ncbi:unnamed protein product [Linum tenue]|uniref:Uncharacterized protein n=1 Tax=Linum tenue TaxID=586396 RepID=A0AAV0HB77_9ROSI|nr:unnamed protein product [Linum tenue]